MNKETLVPGLLGVLIGIILTLLIAPMWVGKMGYINYSMMGEKQVMGSIDSHFIEQMIPHHEDAITMAEIVSEKAEHQEIKQLAQNIKLTQSEEIEKMRNWYRDWYSNDVPNTFSGVGMMSSGMMTMGMMGDSTDIERLKTAENFDKAFIEEMIPHHQMAVMMAQMLQSSTSRPEMKQLAKDIIEAQTKEINSMREWYRQWYGN